MNYETWRHSHSSIRTVAQEPEATMENSTKSEASSAIEEPKSFQPYSIIAEKNIFSSDRKEFAPSGIALAEAPKFSIRPQVILSGVAISDDYQSASVSTPGRPLRKGERETMTLKPGDWIGEYQLAKIAADRITLEAGEDSFEVLLYDPKKAKARVEVRKAEVRAPGVPSIQTAPGPVIAQAQAMVIAAALPSLEENPLYYSRQARSMRHTELNRRAENQQGTGTVYGRTGNMVN